MTDNNLIQRGFIKDSSIYLSATVISIVIGFISLPVYTRFLSPSDYGTVALFLMFGQVSSGLISLGLQSASFRYYFKYKNNLDEYKSLNSSILIFLLIVYFSVGIFIYYLANWFSSTLFDGKITAQLIRWSFLGGCMEYLFTYFTFILTAQLRSVTFSIITILRVIIRTSLSFYFIFIHSLTYLSLIYAILLTQGIMVVSLLFLTGNLIGTRFSPYHFKKSLKFSYPMVLRLVIGTINRSFDKLMLTNITGLSSVGYYSIGEKFATVLKFIMDSIGKVWTPFFQNKAHENTQEAKKAIVKRYLEMSFFLMCIGFILICFSEEMVKLLTTKEYYPAMYIVPVYVFYYLFGLMGMLSIPQIQYSEKTLYILPASIVGVFLNIFLNILLIPEFGALGAVMALSITSIIGSIVHLYFGFKLYPIPLNWWQLAGMFLFTLIFTIPIYLFMVTEINFLVKIVVKIIWISIFFILGLRFNFISKENINMLFSKINPRFMSKLTIQKT